VDFNDSALYSATGTAVDLGTGISLGYSSQITVNAKFTDFLAYVDVSSVVGNGIELKVGEKFVRLNADGGVYSNMAKIGGSGSFDFSALKNGGVIMLEAIGGKLFISSVGNTQPGDLLEEPIAVYMYDGQNTPVDVSVATLTETVLSLESVRLYTLKPTILILGGKDKGICFDSLFEKIKNSRVKSVVLTGESRYSLLDSAKKIGYQNVSMTEDFFKAIDLARLIAEEGDCVLLSPACSSFDCFSDFEHRGDEFISYVENFNE
jgi:hypothetical protein